MKVAIAGYGIEGEASYRYYRNRGDDVTILDAAEEPKMTLPVGAPVRLGVHAFDQLDDFDLIIRTPMMRPDSLKTITKVWSATNEFFAQCPAQIIGVTGTKGKGTTCSLIASILRAAGKTVHLLGNIGTPALEILPRINEQDVVVFEMSSFQLWDIERSPQFAVVLMIEPDHLDVHADFEEYLMAKSNIRRYQNDGDICVYHPNNQYSRQIADTVDVGVRIRYGSSDIGSVSVEGGNFVIDGRVICSVDALQLVGQHNIENACAAITAAQSYVHDSESIAEGLRSFTGLPHRLQFVREHRGVQYYNDSYSSAPAATMAAISAFHQPIILIAGGYDKHTNFAELARNISKNQFIKSVYLLGQTRGSIAAALNEEGFDRYVLCEEVELSPIFERVVSAASTGDIVLLSPGCASFDMFVNFTDRGQQFCSLVEAL